MFVIVRIKIRINVWASELSIVHVNNCVVVFCFASVDHVVWISLKNRIVEIASVHVVISKNYRNLDTINASFSRAPTRFALFGFAWNFCEIFRTFRNTIRWTIHVTRLWWTIKFHPFVEFISFVFTRISTFVEYNRYFFSFVFSYFNG